MGHGGARRGAGNKHKWMLNGEPLETRAVRVPKVIPKSRIEEFVRDYIKELESSGSNQSQE